MPEPENKLKTLLVAPVSTCDFKHPIKGEASLRANWLRNRNLIDYVSLQKRLQAPKQERGMDAVHGGAGANKGVEAKHRAIWMSLCEPLD